jgi:hypothetical protein
MATCSEKTIKDLEKILPNARNEVYALMTKVFSDDMSSSSTMKTLASELDVTLPQQGLGVWGFNIANLLSGWREYNYGNVFRDLEADTRVFAQSQEKFTDAVRHIPEIDREAAIADLRRANTPDPTVPEWYKPALSEIRAKPAFQAIYRADKEFLDEQTGCFIQVARNQVPYNTQILSTTKRITLTVHGTFDSWEAKVGGGWNDPIGTTAMEYAKRTHNSVDLDKNDFVGAFRWGAENTKGSRTDAANSLADNLLEMVNMKETVQKPISADNTLEISLVAHSHGGNVSYEALSHIEARARSGDDFEAERFINYVRQGQVKIRVLGIATPKRADYLPPTWASVVHVSTMGDGVAFLGKTDTPVEQISRFTYSYPIWGDAQHQAAWDELMASSQNTREILLPTYGMKHTLAENHVLSPEALLGHWGETPNLMPETYFMGHHVENAE